MTPDAQGFFVVVPCMVWEVTTLSGVTTRTGQFLAGPWIKNPISDGVGKLPMAFMTCAAHIPDFTLEHIWMVRAMRGMAVITGICFLVAVF